MGLPQGVSMPSAHMLNRAEHRVGAYMLQFVPFVVIAALFAVGAETTDRQMAASRQESEAVVQNMLLGLELVTRMSHDVDRIRLFVDAHIFEKRALEMTKAEGQIAAAKADFESASREYQPIATLPGEVAEWQDLELEVARLDAPLEQALALSRENRDDEAREALMTLESRFTAIDGDAAALIAINRAGADATLARVDALQRSSVARTRLVGLLGIILSLGIGALTSNVLARRQARIERVSAMLQERNRDLDAFAGRVAHDLRGPLGTLTLAVAQVARRAPGETAMIAMLRRTVARMTGIIEGLLALSRSETRPDATCDPAAAAAQVMEDLGPTAPEKNVTLRVAVE
jgi:hypothetical protein